MLFELTAAELKQMDAIRQSYQPERARLSSALLELQGKPDKEEERRRLLIRQQAVLDSLDLAQRKRFKEIEKGGADAIIENAKAQAPTLLENIHFVTAQEYKDATAEALKSMGVGTLKAGALLVNANYATHALRSELYLHIEALRDNKDGLQALLEYLIELVEASPLTDNAEITDKAQKPLKVKRYRRSPLGASTNYGLMNDKTSTLLIQSPELFTQTPDGQLQLVWAVNQAPRESEEEVPVYIALTYEGEDLKFSKPLSAEDIEICNAVANCFRLWQLDNPQKPLYITPQEIWRRMNGKDSRDGSAKPSPAQVKRICERMDKMRFTRCFMDFSKEIEAFHLSIPDEDERLTGGRIDTYVLNSSKVEFFTDKGNTVQGYRIADEPIIYTYNKLKKRVLVVPYEMLDTSQYVSDGENVQAFKGYLLRQIQLMKNATEEGKTGKRFKRSHTILLETIYRDTGIQTPEERADATAFTSVSAKQTYIRKTRKADRQKIEGILDAWKAKGWITGYTVLNKDNEPLKEKQQARGYSIAL